VQTQVWGVVEWKAVDPEDPARWTVLIPPLSFLVLLLAVHDSTPLRVARELVLVSSACFP